MVTVTKQGQGGVDHRSHAQQYHGRSMHATCTYVICAIDFTLRVLFRTHTVHFWTRHIRVIGWVATVSTSEILQLK